MKIQLLLRILVVLMVSCTFGCGGGDSNNAINSNNGYTTVKVHVEATGTTELLYSIQFKVELPAGVILNTTNGDLATGVLTPVGEATGAEGIGGNYVTTTSPSTLAVLMASSTGFHAGNILDISCLVPSGTGINPASIKFLEFKGFDRNGAQLNNITGVLYL